MNIGGNPRRLAYVDAVDGKLLGAVATP